ncbi:MAG: TIGR02757 family protein [bacterium]|nr:TIGR02757 family protein [bacterium]
MPTVTLNTLEKIYSQYNKRIYVEPDPLQFLYDYEDPMDREIVGLIASSLAYGRVAQILKSVRSVLDILGKEPKKFIADNSSRSLSSLFKGFKHRFTTDRELSAFLEGIKKILEQDGSLENCFKKGYEKSHENYIPALQYFVDSLLKASGLKTNSLLADPRRGSACKRLNLYLRWMVRNDEVDPSGWGDMPASKLIVPLDTHMYRFGLAYCFTARKSANLKTAVEITAGFKKMIPLDPVKFDFALTRFGIREELTWEDLENACL